MMLALKNLCEHFCSTGLSVFVGLYMCMCVYIFLQYSERKF